MEPSFTRNNFDLLRLFAATQVMLLHVFVHLRIPFPGWFRVLDHFEGVPMFFTMSGFLVSASWERHPWMANYLRNRVLRIYPALWCALILAMLCIALFSSIGFLHAGVVPWFVSQLAGFYYSPSFLQGWGMGSYNGSLWTIPVELEFYLLLPLLYWIANRMRMPAHQKTIFFTALLCCFGYIAYRFVAFYAVRPPFPQARWQQLAGLSLLPFLYMFLVGVLLQRLPKMRKRWLDGKGIIWVAIFLAWVNALPPGPMVTVIGHALLGLMTVSLAYTMPTLGGRLRGNDISYGVYLYHAIIIDILLENGSGGRLRDVFIVVGISYALAIVSWKWIERPALRRKHRSIENNNLVNLNSK